ncbi:hypothetical protein [Lacinutrix sp. Hel_I_90]|uniref:hypothetical protein n=1 Tax=Lacinutrix sp. Hel_I_90 TaxID=1249999 RepID=UPI0012E01951|nr:hypothetical protein [Lacinutrix sp. Hel_I_90]
MNIEELLTTDRVLAISGILLTIIFSIIGLIVSKREKKKRLVHQKVSKVSLFSDIVKNFQKIQINYNNEKITDDLFYYSGKIYNNGDFDLDKNPISNFFEIEFPDGFKCIEFKITDKSKGLNIDVISIKNKIVQINWDLFKTNEFFKFEVLLKIPDDSSKNYYEISSALDNEIKHNFRISNLDKVDFEELTHPTPVIGCGVLVLFSLSAFLFFSSFSFSKIIYPDYELYIKSTELLHNETIKIEIIDEKTLNLIDVDNNVIKKIPIEDSNTYLTNTIVPIKEKITVIKIISGFFATIFLSFAIINIFNFYLNNSKKVR